MASTEASTDGGAQTDEKERVRTLIKKAKFAMLATKGPDGRYHARPMATSEAEFDGTIWFLTYAETGKTHDIETEPEVLVTYSDNDNAWISVTGTGSILRDREKVKELWSPAYKAWFPKGQDDPNIAIVKIDVENAEYWDSVSNKLVVAYAYAKSVLTGQTSKAGLEHEKVQY